MADTLLERQREASRRSTQRLAEYRRFVLLVMCAVIALVAGYLGSDLARAPSWAAVVFGSLTVIAAFAVAAALLRFIDGMVLRREIADRAQLSELMSKDIKYRLETRWPGIADHAAEIDAAALVERALGASAKKTPFSVSS